MVMGIYSDGYDGDYGYGAFDDGKFIIVVMVVIGMVVRWVA